MLPKLDGLDVAREIRKTSDTPIIMVSAKDSEFDKVIGLELGADDYVTKPFSNRELLARIKANLRRINVAPAESTDNVKKELIIGNLRINPAHYAAYKNDKQLDLTHREFELLYYLAQHLGEVITVKIFWKQFGATITLVMCVQLTLQSAACVKKLKIHQAVHNTFQHAAGLAIT